MKVDVGTIMGTIFMRNHLVMPNRLGPFGSNFETNTSRDNGHLVII